MNLESVVEVCCDLARRAGRVILDVYQTDFSVEQKADHSPVTEADRLADSLIGDGLRSAFPDAAILSEESADDGSRLPNPWCFVVDPLDGTKEFVQRNGEFTVNIALAREGVSVAGVVYLPVDGALYYAWEGGGAWLLSAPGAAPERLSVSDKLADLTVAVSRSHRTEREVALLEAQAQKIGRTVTAGSSIKGCLVASGQADVFYRFGPTMEWDTAAMQCIVEEAGGLFSQMDGTPMRYNRVDSRNAKGFYAVNRAENVWV